MKKTIILMCFALFLSVSTGIYAQHPQGGHGAPPPTGHPPVPAGKNGYVLDHFPDIPGLTFKQRADVGNILMKEHEDVELLMIKRQELIAERDRHFHHGEKERRSYQRKIDKIDLRIAREREDANRKIRKVLTPRQYEIFMSRRADFRFRKEPPARFNGAPNNSPHSRSEGRRP